MTDVDRLGSGASPTVVMVEPTPGMRGPQRTLLDLARYLAPRLRLVVAIPEGFVSRVIGSDVPDAQILPLPFHPSRTTSWIHGATALMSSLGAEDGDVLIHANGLSALNLAAPLARRLSAPVFVHFHAPKLPARSRLFLRVWKRAGVRMAFFPVSDFSRALLERSEVRDLVRGTLPNPIDASGVPTERARPHRPFRVGFMGSKSPNKGLHLLLEIAGLLRGEEIEWHVFGIDLHRTPTPYVARCLEMVEHDGLKAKVRWRGKLEDMRHGYAEVDLLLVPSTLESQSRVALEAMANGLPVVATRVGGLPEVVREGVSGWLFDPDRPGDAAAHIGRMRDDQELWRVFSRAAVRAAASFDITAVGSKLEGFYAELLRDRTSVRHVASA